MRTAELTQDTVTSRDGTTIGYYKVGRDGNGPAVVVLHGSMESARSHLLLAEALATDFTVYLPDRRGRGLSGPQRPDHTVSTEVEDLEAVLTATGGTLAFGVSAGGAVVLEAARTLSGLAEDAPNGVASSGVAPSGGVALSGAPSGVAPSGAPSGVAPSGAPSGVASSGLAPNGVASSGVAPGEGALQKGVLEKIALYEPAIVADGAPHRAWLARFDEEIGRGDVAGAMVTSMFGFELAPPFLKIMPRGLLRWMTEKMMVKDERQAAAGAPTMRQLAPTVHVEGAIVAELAGTFDNFRTLNADVLLLGGTKGLPGLEPGRTTLGKVLPHCRRIEFDGFDHGSSSDPGGVNPKGSPEAVRRIADEVKVFFKQ